MLTFTEYFLNITMVNGNKIFETKRGGSHVLKAFRISNAKGANSETIATGQSSLPVTTLQGRKAIQLTISSYWSFSEIPSILTELAGSRIINEMVNIFLPGSVLIVTENDINRDISLNSAWMVDRFSFRRSKTRRGVIIYDLTLIEWNNDLVTFDPDVYWGA